MSSRTATLKERDEADILRAETLAKAVQELYVRFNPALMIEATKDQSLFITDRNAAMIFFRCLPNENNPIALPF